MKIRTKLAAVTLAAGTLVGGGAALAMGSPAEAKPVVVDPTDHTIGTIGKGPLIDRKTFCRLFPEKCKPGTTDTTKPKDTTSTTAKQETTTSTKYTPTTKYNPPYQPPYDPPVKAKPVYTG